jgi:hypothetical protein
LYMSILVWVCVFSFSYFWFIGAQMDRQLIAAGLPNLQLVKKDNVPLPKSTNEKWHLAQLGTPCQE